MNALSEKSNQVRDSRTQWEAEQAAAASSNAGGAYSRSTAAGRSYSNNGGGAASQSTGSAGGSQGGSSSSSQSYWVETQAEDPSLGWTCSGSLGSDPTRCWVTMVRKCTVVKTVSGTDLISQPKAQTIQ